MNNISTAIDAVAGRIQDELGCKTPCGINYLIVGAEFEFLRSTVSVSLSLNQHITLHVLSKITA